jgi:hypothetical protein
MPPEARGPAVPAAFAAAGISGPDSQAFFAKLAAKAKVDLKDIRPWCRDHLGDDAVVAMLGEIALELSKDAGDSAARSPAPPASARSSGSTQLRTGGEDGKGAPRISHEAPPASAKKDIADGKREKPEGKGIARVPDEEPRGAGASPSGAAAGRLPYGLIPSELPQVRAILAKLENIDLSASRKDRNVAAAKVFGAPYISSTLKQKLFRAAADMYDIEPGKAYAWCCLHLGDEEVLENFIDLLKRISR